MQKGNAGTAKPRNGGDQLRSPSEAGGGSREGGFREVASYTSRFGRSPRGAAEHPQPLPAATGVERPEQRLLPVAAAGNFRQSFLPFLPRPPMYSSPKHSPGLAGSGAEMEVPAPVLALRAPACAAPASGLSFCFPSDHLPTRLTHYERCQVRALLPGPETLASDSRVSPTSQAPREL